MKLINFDFERLLRIIKEGQHERKLSPINIFNMNESNETILGKILKNTKRLTLIKIKSNSYKIHYEIKFKFIKSPSSNDLIIKII